MDKFSNIDNSSEVEAEITETEVSDADLCTGDSINDFDSAYEAMNSGKENLEYLPEGSDPNELTENRGSNNETTDANIEEVLSDFEDSEYMDKNAMFENVSYCQGQNDIGALGTCGPTSIANSLNRVTGTTEYTENKVLHNAMDNGLCRKSDDPYSCGGTTTHDVVNIIDRVKSSESNIHTEVYEYDQALSVDTLAERLDDPKTVAMVGVDSATLWDQKGDVISSGLFQHTDAPSDHWITVDSSIRDEGGNLKGFNVIDSGGGVSEVTRDKFEAMYMGNESHMVSDPTVILISNEGEVANTYSTSDDVEKA